MYIPNARSSWLPPMPPAEIDSHVFTCALCGALTMEPNNEYPDCWKEIDGELYCPDCWHICPGIECGHRPEDGERCAQVNDKPRQSVECFASGHARCPWITPSVNAAGKRGIVCMLPDERGDECPRVVAAANERASQPPSLPES